AKREKAAITIQRAWRYYQAKRHRIQFAQKLLQDTIENTFVVKSIKIQALFRGWQSRKYFNNMHYLKIVQLNGLEEVLRCMVYKMHTIYRWKELPGLRTLRKDCSIKLEEYLSTMKYRFYNQNLGNRLEMHKTMRAYRRKEFEAAKEYTWLPFLSDLNCKPGAIFDPISKIYTTRNDDVAKAFIHGQNQEKAQKKQARLLGE
ncbi:hypothetical protein KR222_009711, partial [Zaprionus bogoriensis]